MNRIITVRGNGMGRSLAESFARPGYEVCPLARSW